MGAFSSDPTPRSMKTPLVSIAFDCEEILYGVARLQKVWEANGEATQIHIDGKLIVEKLRKGKRYRIIIEETD